MAYKSVNQSSSGGEQAVSSGGGRRADQVVQPQAETPCVAAVSCPVAGHAASSNHRPDKR